MSRVHWQGLAAAALLMGLQLACSAAAGAGTATPTADVVVVGPSGCDARATEIEPGRTYQQQVEATNRPYPANCRYYCLMLAEPRSQLEITLSDFRTDLDLFVAYGEFEALIAEVPREEAGKAWASNQYGLREEQVTIGDPLAGPYYIEVCSFERDASYYNLRSRLR